MHHEERFLALLTFLEEEHRLEVLASLSKLGMKGSRELRYLEFSINYAAKFNVLAAIKVSEGTSSVLKKP